MRPIGLIVVVMVVAAAFTSLSSARAPLAPRGPGAVIAMHASLFRAIDAGKVDDALKLLHEDMNKDDGERARPCSLFLCDLKGQPLASRNQAESKKLLAEWIAASVADGNWTTTVTSIGADCFSAELSYAVLEIARTKTVDGKPVTRRYRSTSLVTHAGQGWEITHMHLSPAEAATAGAATVQAL